jgi:amino acid transporter
MDCYGARAELDFLRSGEDDPGALRAAGRRWSGAVGERREWDQALPVDPELSRAPAEADARGLRRLVSVDFAPHGTREVEATQAAYDPVTAGARLGTRLLRAVLGPPLRTTAIAHERMRKLVALPVLSADALSSVAYGPEALLAVLVVGGSAGLGFALPVAAVVATLMLAVGVSYRQTIRAYPQGGGSYVVAGANLGRPAGLVAAAGLMTDYVVTVAISVAAGVAAVTSAVPPLTAAVVPVGAAVIALLVAANLRGVREAGSIFAAPTYAFVIALAALVATGLWQAIAGGPAPTPAAPPHAAEAVGLLLVLRAFASGSTAMTGIETISNAVPGFQAPQAGNARTTLTVMVGLLIALFAGTMALAELEGVVPRTGETVLSQLAQNSFGTGPLYLFTQAATAAVLLLAANSAFNGFPRLLSFMARDRQAPRLFLHIGDRLAYSNGIIALGIAAGVVFCVTAGSTDRLIPLYAVGVFLAFTLCQAGMVVHWHRERGAHWRRSLTCNALGGVLSGVVFLVAAATKFSSGAWVALAAGATIIAASAAIRRHYDAVARAVALDADTPGQLPTFVAPERARSGGEAHEQMSHLTVIPVASLDLISLHALAHAASLRQPLLAVHVSPDQQDAERFVAAWRAWGDHLRLEVLLSPYRAIVVPFVRYLDALHRQRPDLTITVVLGELVVENPIYRLLHEDLEPRIRRGLRGQRNVVVETVPFHFPQR